VLRRIFGPKEESAGDWRRLHNEELHNLYALPNIIRVIKSRRMQWVWHVARMGKMRNEYKILAGKPEGEVPHRRLWCRWEVNIRMGLRKIWWEGADWIHLAQGMDQWWALVNAIMNHQIL